MSGNAVGEAMFNVFSLKSSLFTLAYRSFFDLHGEMVFPCVLGDVDSPARRTAQVHGPVIHPPGERPV